MYYTVIKHSSHLRTLEKCRKHSPSARAFHISLVFSNACRVLSQCNTRLRLLYLLNKHLHPHPCIFICYPLFFFYLPFFMACNFMCETFHSMERCRPFVLRCKLQKIFLGKRFSNYIQLSQSNISLFHTRAVCPNKNSHPCSRH